MKGRFNYSSRRSRVAAKAAETRRKMPSFGSTCIGTLIRENELSTEAKYNAFRRKHPELGMPTGLEVRRWHTETYGQVN